MIKNNGYNVANQNELLGTLNEPKEFQTFYYPVSSFSNVYAKNVLNDQIVTLNKID